MKYDQFGVPHLTQEDLCLLIYNEPSIDIGSLLVDNPEVYNNSVQKTYADFPRLKKYVQSSLSLEEFDFEYQQNWFMPAEYMSLDIDSWLISQCDTDQEIDRIKQELVLFNKKNLRPLLQYLKYLVDVMRENQIVWGVGRGSSVASFVLYKIGVHRINSLQYDLSIDEFLKD